MKVRIRDARRGELDTLTAIAHRAKRHWGYPEAWLERWRTDLTYTEMTLRACNVVVAEDEVVCGVASLSVDPNRKSAEIEGLWVEPDRMGHGIGRALFAELVLRARAANADRLRIVSDPQAEGFYLRMGATRRGTVPSTPEGRVLPELWLDLTSGQKKGLDRDALRAHQRAGARLKFLFFWSHEPKRAGAIDASCLSNWFPAPFDVDGIRYPTSEHYLMAEKARLFGDSVALNRILDAPHPGAAKQYGREVRGFVEATWIAQRQSIMVRGVTAKFRQNPPLADYLIGTRNRVLVEASPRDRIWGVGLSEGDPRAENPSEWLGLNLLGFALMEVRDGFS